MKVSKNKFILVGVMVAALLLAYWSGGTASIRNWSWGQPPTADTAHTDHSMQLGEPPSGILRDTQEVGAENNPENQPEENVFSIAAIDNPENQSPGEPKDAQAAGEPALNQDQNPPATAGNPTSADQQNTGTDNTAYTCTLTVSCSTLLDHLEGLKPEKRALVPTNGVILPPTVVTFYAGESVFNVLQREMKKAKIHLEFVHNPIYNSTYIEGIHNIYEFDCGDLSGWMYQVNDWFPNYGCSRYLLQPNDEVTWVYTCDLGADVGSNSATVKDQQ